MNKYTTLLFDTDNTLLDFTMSEAHALKDALEAHGIRYSEHVRRTYSAVNNEFWKNFERGRILKSEIYVGRFKTTLEKLGIQADAEKVAAEYEKRLAEYHFAIPGAIEMCKELRKEYDINIVTNGHRIIQNQRLTDSGLKDIVNNVFISEDVGVPKPEKGFFDYVFAHIAQKDKTKILIIGDSPTSDIAGGINAGIDTCFYNPGKQQTEIKPTYEINIITDLLKVLG